MSNIIECIQNIGNISGKKSYEVFKIIKPHLIREFTSFLDSRRVDSRGCKRTVNLDLFFEAVFAVCDNSLKMCNLEKSCSINKSTYYKYLTLLRHQQFFENINKIVINQLRPKETISYTMIDTMTMKSMDGSVGLGRNPTDRGRKGLKCSTITDDKGIIHSAILAPANQHDSKLLVPTFEASVTDLTGQTCYADSGYAGSKYISRVNRLCHINLISKPKKTRAPGVMSHTLSPQQMIDLQQRRHRIERSNQNIRNFRGLMIKYSKTISTYQTYLFLAILCTNIYLLVTS